MTVSLATPCRNCSHPLNVHDNGGDERVVRACITCSCERYEPDACYWGHSRGCEHQDSPYFRNFPGGPVSNPDREYVRTGNPPDEVANPDRTRFETKDSGVRAEFESGMVRDSQDGKARFELLLPLGVPYEDQFLVRVAELMARGAEKYDSRNWEKASGQEELERFKSSALRHLMQWAAGETDEDHAAAVVFNLLGYETTRIKIKEE